MKIALILLIVLTSGCSLFQKEYVEVPIDRPVYCAELPEIEEYATEELDKDAQLYDKIQALLVEREQRRATEAELRAIIKGCSKEEG